MNSKKTYNGARIMQVSTKRADLTLLRKILGATNDIPERVYAPRDDSFLMLDALLQIEMKGKNVLDIGTGSGILALCCLLRGGRVTATDTDPVALRHAGKAAERLGLDLKLVLSDLFSNIHKRFDLILFNPPYLPGDEITDPTVDGGAQGKVLTDRFLRHLPKYLKEKGTALLLVSSLNELKSLIDQHSQFRLSVIAERKLFFEELRVLSVGLR